MGCNIDFLCLLTKKYSDEEIRNLILDSDIIYVGGGDTVGMMEKWKEYHVDKYLMEAYKNGIVLSGISAGSICWFEFGHSDDDSSVNDGQWDFTRAHGLGLIPAVHCPHYNEDGHEGFAQMLLGEILPGIALEDGTAFIELDSKYTVIKENNKSKAYIIYNVHDRQIKRELEEKSEVDLRNFHIRYC